jgi:hypothetical protein
MTRLDLDTRKSLKPWITGLFNDPLAIFDETYDHFMAGLGTSADAMDQWIMMQLSILTDMGEGRGPIMTQFVELFNQVMKGLGGNAFTQLDVKDITNNPSLVIAAIIRVYGGMTDVTDYTQGTPS